LVYLIININPLLILEYPSLLDEEWGLLEINALNTSTCPFMRDAYSKGVLEVEPPWI
jgi:hypothetical protein